MSMFIARIANKLGYTNFAMKTAVKKYGKVYGETSLSGLRAFKKITKEKSIITVLNNDFTPHSQMIVTAQDYGRVRTFNRNYMFSYPCYDAHSILKRTKMPDGSIHCEHTKITPKDYGSRTKYESWVNDIPPVKKK